MFYEHANHKNICPGALNKILMRYCLSDYICLHSASNLSVRINFKKENNDWGLEKVIVGRNNGVVALMGFLCKKMCGLLFRHVAGFDFMTKTSRVDSP